jgi:hypothetical protein
MAQLAGFGTKAHRLFLSIASGRTKIPNIGYKAAPSSSGSSSSAVTGESTGKEESQTQVAPSPPSPPAAESHITIVRTSADTNGSGDALSTTIISVKDTCSAEADLNRPPYIATEYLIADTDAGALQLQDGTDEESCRAIVDQALAMLATLFKPEHTSGFLLQVVAGRFHGV